MKAFLSIAVAGILLAAVVIYVYPVDAAPFYTKKTTHKIVALVKFDSDCWEEIYARAVPKGHNGEVLNKQTKYNNDEPDSGSSEVIKFVWYFKLSKQTNTGADTTRMYVEIEFPNGEYGTTVNKYKSFATDDFRWDFGTFNMKTNPEICESLQEMAKARQ